MKSDDAMLCSTNAANGAQRRFPRLNSRLLLDPHMHQIAQSNLVCIVDDVFLRDVSADQAIYVLRKHTLYLSFPPSSDRASPWLPSGCHVSV